MPDDNPCICVERINPACPVDGGTEVLLTAVDRLKQFDLQLAGHLNDLAADYAGPYTEESDG
jgi:hypothetical protein